MKIQTKIVQSTLTNVFTILNDNFLKLKNQYNIMITKINTKHDGLMDLEVDLSIKNYFLKLTLL